MAWITQANISAYAFGAYAADGQYANTDANAFVDAVKAISDNQVIIAGSDAAPARSLLDINHVFLAGARLKFGMDISNNTGDATNDIDISAGGCSDSTGVYFMTGGAMTKRLDAAWAAGTNQGGIFSGAKGASTWYAVHAIRKDSDASVDYGFDTSATAANKPAGYTYYRRIGYILTDGASAILAFYKIGNRFYLTTKIQNVAATNPGTNAVLAAITVPPSLLGIVSCTLATSYVTARIFALFSCPTDTDSTPSVALFDISAREQYATSGYEDWNSTEKTLQVDSSSRVRYRISYSDATTIVYIMTNGWIDTGLLG
jgi:hypothetical protein